MGEGNESRGADFLGRRILLEGELRGTIKLWKGEDGEMKCRSLQPRTWGEWERKPELM